MIRESKSAWKNSKIKAASLVTGFLIRKAVLTGCNHINGTPLEMIHLRVRFTLDCVIDPSNVKLISPFHHSLLVLFCSILWLVTDFSIQKPAASDRGGCCRDPERQAAAHTEDTSAFWIPPQMLPTNARGSLCSWTSSLLFFNRWTTLLACLFDAKSAAKCYQLSETNTTYSHHLVSGIQLLVKF